MHTTGVQPPNIHCRVCGAEMQVGNVRRTRVRSPGWGGDGTSTVTHISFGYVRGPVWDPNGAVHLSQGSSLEHAQGPQWDSSLELLHIIESQLRNYAPERQSKAWSAHGDSYSEWNLERVAKARHDQKVIEVGGTPSMPSSRSGPGTPLSWPDCARRDIHF